MLEMKEGCIDAMRKRLRASSSEISSAAMSDWRAFSLLSVDDDDDVARCWMNFGGGICSFMSSKGSSEYRIRSLPFAFGDLVTEFDRERGRGSTSRALKNGLWALRRLSSTCCSECSTSADSHIWVCVAVGVGVGMAICKVGDIAPLAI